MIISSCFTNTASVSCVMLKVTQVDLSLIIYLKKCLMWLDSLVPASTAAISPKQSTVASVCFKKQIWLKTTYSLLSTLCMFCEMQKNGMRKKSSFSYRPVLAS